MDVRLGDILLMKKEHPCGEKRWLVLRIGADFRLKCMKCGHEIMTPRFKAEKNIRQILREENISTDKTGNWGNQLPVFLFPGQTGERIHRVP